jgi:hypothetical protein
MCIKGFSGNMRERDHLKDPGIDGRIIRGWKGGGHRLERSASG